MNAELTTTLLTGLGTAIGSFVTWLFNKKSQAAKAKQESEIAEGLEIDNQIKLSEAAIKLLDELTERYEGKYQSLVEMYDRKVKMLEDEIKLLLNRNKTLTEENKELKKLVKELKEQQ